MKAPAGNPVPGVDSGDDVVLVSVAAAAVRDYLARARLDFESVREEFDGLGARLAVARGLPAEVGALIDQPVAMVIKRYAVVFDGIERIAAVLAPRRPC